MRRNSSQGKTQRKNIATFANRGIGSYNKSNVGIGGDINGGGTTLIARTLDTSYAKQYGCDNQHVDARCPNFILFENLAADSRIKETKISPTLNSRMGACGASSRSIL